MGSAVGVLEVGARDVAAVLVEGPLSERDIARELFLSFNTVHSHTKSIYHTLDVSSRAGP